MNSTELYLEEVNKTYPNGLQALTNVSLQVKPGSIFGLIGPNGAGKSTLLKLASGLLKPDSGRVLCGEKDITGNAPLAATYVGLMPDPLGVYTDISCSEYLEFFARLLEIDHTRMRHIIAEIVELLELGPWLHSEVESLSAGWQRRLALGRTLLLKAPVLLLDEPAAGLDISARRALLSIVRRLKEVGHTIIISSHILPELEELADTFGILRQGSWVEILPGRFSLTREELLRGFGQMKYGISCDRLNEANTRLIEAGFVVTEFCDERLLFLVDSPIEATRAISILISSGHIIYEANKINLDLDDLVQSLLSGE